MRRRHPLPTIWLMSDPRMGDLMTAIGRLPKGAGIIFRHYALPRAARRALFELVRRRVAGRHLLLLADTPGVARQWRADGAHSSSLHRSHGLRTVAVHDRREAARANRIGADLLFVSPVFATRSHPGARAIGTVRLGRIAGQARKRTIALGGMNKRRAKSLAALKIYGWAGIDAFRT